MQPETVRLSYSLSLSVLPDFISQDYRLGFPATFKHNSNRLIGTVSLISFHRERLQWPTNGPAPAPPGAQELGSTWFYWICQTPLRPSSFAQFALPRAAQHPADAGRASFRRNDAPKQPPRQMTLGQHQPIVPDMLDQPAAGLHQPLHRVRDQLSIFFGKGYR